MGAEQGGRGSSHLNSLSFIILIISDAKASGSPRHSTFLAACDGEDIIRCTNENVQTLSTALCLTWVLNVSMETFGA